MSGPAATDGSVAKGAEDAVGVVGAVLSHSARTCSPRELTNTSLSLNYVDKSVFISTTRGSNFRGANSSSTTCRHPTVCLLRVQRPESFPMSGVTSPSQVAALLALLALPHAATTTMFPEDAQLDAECNQVTSQAPTALPSNQLADSRTSSSPNKSFASENSSQ